MTRCRHICIKLIKITSHTLISYISHYSIFSFSVASILTIPVAVLLEWWLKDFILSWQALVGVGTILAGFVGLVTSEIWETRKKAKQSAEESEEKETLIEECPKLSKASIKMKLKSVRLATINSLTWNNIKSVLLDHIL